MGLPLMCLYSPDASIDMQQILMKYICTYVCMYVCIYILEQSTHGVAITAQILFTFGRARGSPGLPGMARDAFSISLLHPKVFSYIGKYRPLHQVRF